jgi:two-component system sensor histidine kinase BarA
MSYRGIKRVLGESSLERKIRILFGICLLLLIAGSFLWVNRITEDLIRLNTQDQARSLKPEYILRTHLKNAKFTDDSSRPLFELLATEAAATPYRADPIVLDDRIGRHQLNPIVATDPNEIRRLQKLMEQAVADQSEQNKLEVRKSYGEASADSEQPLPLETDNLGEDFTTDEQYVYYTPLIFKSKSQCMGCHFPVAKDPKLSPELEAIARKFESSDDPEEQKKLDLERLSLAPPVFLRITLLDNQAAQTRLPRIGQFLFRSRLSRPFFSVAAIWLIVRYVIVKPLAICGMSPTRLATAAWTSALN